MKPLQLNHYITINQIGAASGIVHHNNSLYIISDNSGYLYQYHIQTEQLYKHPLIHNPTHNIPKKQKPDFECITLNGTNLHIFGSGSTPNRNTGIVFNTQSHQINSIDYTLLYEKIKTQCHISSSDLNIEGVIYHGNDLLLFQRGNGTNANNGIIKVSPNNDIQYFTIKLPQIQNIETSFTDAVLVQNTIYFLAAAENTTSTYQDGEILGTIIGTININNMTLNSYQEISLKHKFEGLTLYENTPTQLTFLLCEDNDTSQLISNIYKLSLTIH